MPLSSKQKRRIYMGYPMAERIQLKDPGSELVMTVTSVRAETVEKNDYYLFGNGHTELLVPQSSVKAQSERLDITRPEQMVGRSVRFARSMKMSRANKPFWDIDWASGAETSAGGDQGKPTTGTSASVPSVEPPAEKPKLTGLYRTATEYVLKEIVPLYEAAEIGMNSADVAACVQTLFIAAAKER